ncbi:tagaturonate reductase [Erwiniaceae bacterium BAC15a-03b]|uniref:Tagaturonate reductase n=1 Tax=Winslowiella arboricola TaxID=2978220 RepID=A0A9J6PIV5_9GAMM|nr:tagaturonate reductase [Winslowiella arboricola]MCU5771804.1 tagaturonate reductase [Winslowiella arboricola]MCU5776654.1 tagaturonate reductase [Winslowiella arboricola]
MQTLNRNQFPGRQHPDRIIQFGEGNFLRAFVDWQIDLLNEHTDLDAGIVVLRPINSQTDNSLNSQDGLYTALIRGLNDQGEVVSEPRLVRSVNREIHIWRQFEEFLALARDASIRLVFSNTTEAGIAYDAADRLEDTPANSFPAKLTRLLYERFKHFNAAADKGWIILPCELIDDNGAALKALVLRYAQQWQLPAAFTQWLEQHNTFCSTLVDRIVTGYPQDEAEQIFQQLGYRDNYLDTGEVYYQFVIQGPAWLQQELRLDRYPLNVRLVDDIKPYKEQKVAILNGAHTALVPVAYLAGLDTVGEAMNDTDIAAFVDRMLRDEIIPTLDLPGEQLHAFADAVLSRFRNPFIRHQLLSIALNSMTKFRTRLLPQLLVSQQQQGHWPRRLTFAFAALLVFYRGQRHGETFSLQDDAHWLQRFATLWPQLDRGEITPQQLVECVLADKTHWQQDLTQLPGLVAAVTEHLQIIVERGTRAAAQQLG